jgi:hypothetical protein
VEAVVDRNVKSGKFDWFHQLPYEEKLRIDRKGLAHWRGDRKAPMGVQ